ncbi:S1C family serine protease [Roseimaritima sediminicola]|uniref:S1C family serine protease n=1 Tax=Roseimaritima sediminicola TaxID=2662066 RepID=UPI001F29967A|nr:trypsin-like peptidase domain-containing protein [Roseimaritima sediminicola]
MYLIPRRWLLAALLIASPLPAVPPAVAQSPTDQAASSANVVAEPSPADAPAEPTAAASGSASLTGSASDGLTYVQPPERLVGLIRQGKVPSDLEELLALEQQQKKIAELAAECTVNVQINGHEAGNTQGCGVVITPDGFVLTAAHVAERPGLRVRLTFADGRTYAGRTLGMNREVDAGLIRIEPGQNDGRPWPHASLGSSEDLRPGMWCVATGHPGGYDLDRGVVTRVGRILSIRPGSIVTDCALIGGDSGGPLFDMQGRLIAVHSRIGNDVADNLHVPVDHYSDSWDDLCAGKAWGFLPGFRPVLGVRGAPDSELAIIDSVHRRSPADQAGIQAGDIIERFGQDAITDFQSLKDAVDQTMPGKRVVIRLRRDGQVKRVIVEIGRDPRSD